MRKPPVFESITPKQVMNKVTAPEMPFQWSINPYRGCTHGCSFCYARVTHTYMGLAADDTFRHHVFVKENASDVLNAQLRRKLKHHQGDYARLQKDIGLVNIGTATDPYQPIEAHKRETRKCLEVLAHYGIQTSITTRSPLIRRDIDILKQMNIQSIHLSVNTLDKSVWRNLEPATPAPQKRLETIQTLADAGLPVGILLAPIIPHLTDSREQLHDVIRLAIQHGAHFIIPSVLRLSGEVKTWFLQTIQRHYPELVGKYQRLYQGAYAPQSYVRPLMDSVHAMLDELQMTTDIPPRPLSRCKTGQEDTRSSEDGAFTDSSCVNRGEIGSQSVQLTLPI
ncbi:SPL family radical SAM protein [Alicyclobacillus suci]|uniref:SPL family radical SAM protein n=1 Tax=Alicyclobacillus suci TaxID=2816080 RepID=UPI001A8F7869|nr:radical SAM protein [Alicyclobacillus suci]